MLIDIIVSFSALCGLAYLLLPYKNIRAIYQGPVKQLLHPDVSHQDEAAAWYVNNGK